MDHLRRRPDAQLRFVVSDDAIQQDAKMVVPDAVQVSLQLGPHLVNRTRCAEDRIFFAEALAPILIGIHTPYRRQDQLDAAVVIRRSRFDAHELAGLEFILVAIDVGHQLRDDLSG
jgi:hypothetical protein